MEALMIVWQIIGIVLPVLIIGERLFGIYAPELKGATDGITFVMSAASLVLGTVLAFI